MFNHHPQTHNTEFLTSPTVRWLVLPTAVLVTFLLYDFDLFVFEPILILFVVNLLLIDR